MCITHALSYSLSLSLSLCLFFIYTHMHMNYTHQGLQAHRDITDNQPDNHSWALIDAAVARTHNFRHIGAVMLRAHPPQAHTHTDTLSNMPLSGWINKRVWNVFTVCDHCGYVRYDISNNYPSRGKEYMISAQQCGSRYQKKDRFRPKNISYMVCQEGEICHISLNERWHKYKKLFYMYVLFWLGIFCILGLLSTLTIQRFAS